MTTRSVTPIVCPNAAVSSHVTAMPTPPTGPVSGRLSTSAAGQTAEPGTQPRSASPEPAG
ncbi:MAG: hypothetical protein D3X82_07620 [Candidatus Leucobacter sulfamidivorax]|nr:hypothetical protein [Candidatus Leucobacter sulfamidivorax]